MNPKVFVSHASEDKERFVINFATKLRQHGVDAWLDKWEMLPGDSLVDKIFEEGLKDAQAIIIVLSNFSVEKPWVREELNASIVSKLTKGTKIIPIVLDNCEVPECLTSTLWESIKDINDYETNFQRIKSSIFGATDKPALGKVPVHISSIYHEIGGLTKADNLILKESCEYIIKNNDAMVRPEALFGDGEKLGFSRNEIKDCIETLEKNRYLDASRFLAIGNNSYNSHFRVTTYGFIKYAETYLNDYESTLTKIISAIVNENITDNLSIQKKLNQPIVIINYILDALEINGHIKLSKSLGELSQIYHVAVSLRRSL